MQVFPDVLLLHQLGVHRANRFTNAKLATTLSTLPLVLTRTTAQTHFKFYSSNHELYDALTPLVSAMRQNRLSRIDQTQQCDKCVTINFYKFDISKIFTVIYLT